MMADMENSNELNQQDLPENRTTVEETAGASVSSKPVKQKKKNGKPNFFVRLGKRIARFWRDFMSERKKIVWMSWKNVCRSSAVVIVLVVILSAILLGIDTAFSAFFAWLAKLI